MAANAESFFTCQTCFRSKPAVEFVMPIPAKPDRFYQVKLCRSCRGILWDNPDDVTEGYPYC